MDFTAINAGDRRERSGSMVMVSNVVNESAEAVTNVEDALALAGGFGRF